MIKIKSKGNWDRTSKFFKKSTRITKVENITVLAERCIDRLIDATPKDSGLTASSWSYEIERLNNNVKVYINNSNIQNGINVALLLEFGHATNGGSWVEGQDFIGLITQEEYNKILSDTWKEMERL